MIPSTGPMAADRRRSVARMMTTAISPVSCSTSSTRRDALLAAAATPRETPDEKRSRRSTGRPGGKGERTTPPRTRPTRWSVANWLDPARLDAQRPCRSPPAACGIGYGCATDSCQPTGGALPETRARMEPKVDLDHSDYGNSPTSCCSKLQLTSKKYHQLIRQTSETGVFLQ